MKALITGGAGFAGSHLAEHLLEQGHEVTILTRSDDRLRNLKHVLANVRVARADILDREGISELLKQVRPQRIYHLAALSSPSDSFHDPGRTYGVNFTGTFNLLWSWRQAAFDSRFLFVSSSQVYGRPTEQHLPFREDAPMRPVSPYAGSKAAAEMLAVQFFESDRLPIIRVRPFNHTGPRQDPDYVCSSLARQVAEIELGLRPPVVSAGNLDACRDFSDVRDIVYGYHLLLERGQAGEVYQLCSGTPVSVHAILRHLIAWTSKPVEIAVEVARIRSRDFPSLWGDPSRAAEAVGWQPRYDLATTLRDLEEYWENSLRSRAPEAFSPVVPDVLGALEPGDSF
jgi:GDP-4-dehydro-6-deoxy-D-mannose reductase